MFRREQLRSLAPGLGACLATDEIIVHGARVGYMYRERPTEIDDSGWRFMAGTETQEHVDDPSNTFLVDVNTIANHDPEIIPLLPAPVGSAFERLNAVGAFRPCAPPEDADRLPASS